MPRANLLVTGLLGGSHACVLSRSPSCPGTSKGTPACSLRWWPLCSSILSSQPCEASQSIPFLGSGAQREISSNPALGTPQSLYSPLFPAGTVPTPLFPSAPREASPQSSPARPATAPAPGQEPGGPSLPPPSLPGGPSLSPPTTPRSAPALPSRAGGDRVHHHPVQLHVQQQLRGRHEQEAHPHHHHPGDQRVSGCGSGDGRPCPLREGWGPSGRNPPLQGAPPGMGTWQPPAAPARSRGKAPLCRLGKGLARRDRGFSPASASPPTAGAFLCPRSSSSPGHCCRGGPCAQGRGSSTLPEPTEGWGGALLLWFPSGTVTCWTEPRCASQAEIGSPTSLSSQRPSPREEIVRGTDLRLSRQRPESG